MQKWLRNFRFGIGWDVCSLPWPPCLVLVGGTGTPAWATDYVTDDDTLIEISNLAQLNATLPVGYRRRRFGTTPPYYGFSDVTNAAA